MIVPEPTSFIESSKTLATAVKNSGITISEARIAFNSLTMTSIADSNTLVYNPVVWNDKIAASSSPRHAQELHNCENCGGTIDEKGYCRFCGSRVYFFGS